MGTKNNPGSFDCYAAALPDEPLFHLLGRDPAFPATVRFWMGERARLGKNVDNDDLDKIGEAALVAQAAEKWRDQIVLDLEPGDYPWRNRPHVDSYDRDPPVRRVPGFSADERAKGFDRVEPWSGDQGGPVRVQEIRGWDEWVALGSLSIARLAFGKSGVPSLQGLVELIAATEREGWQVEHMLGYQHGYEIVFRRVSYVFTSQAQVFQPPVAGSMGEAIQDNLQLRAKAVVGLNQIANDLARFVNGKVSDPENHETAKGLLAFVDRINGYAAELGDGVPVDMIPLPQVDPARGADTSHATVAVAPENALDFGDPDNDPSHHDEPLELTPDMEVPAARPCDPLDEDCTGMGRGLQP